MIQRFLIAIALLTISRLVAADDRRFVFVALDQAGGGKPLASYPASDPWSSIPQGRQVFEQVPFDVVTKVQLAGNVDSKDGRLYPARSIGIVVGNKLARLHVLHAGNIAERDGRPMAALRLRYADGSTSTMFISYGVHVRNYWKDRAEKSDAVSDTNSILVWTGRSADGDKSGATHRLYMTSLDLPPSNSAVEFIDVLSLFSNSSLSILAMTGEVPATAATGLPAPAADASKYRDDIVLNVTDRDGAPVGGARARGVALNERNASTTLGRMDDATEELGVVPVDFPAGTRELRLVLAANGYVSSELNLQAAPGEPFRRMVPVRLDRGVRVGGMVSDAEGVSIPKAKVSIYRVAPSPDITGKSSRFRYVESVTDIRGRWVTREVPESMENLLFRVTHDDFRPIEMEFSGAGTGLLTREALLASRSVFKFAPGLIISGTVQDEAGRLLPDIEVTFLRTNAGKRITARERTDAKGHFHFAARESGHARLVVHDPGFAPAVQLLDLDQRIDPVAIALKKGMQLKLRAVEVETRQQPANGPPIPGVTLSALDGGNTPFNEIVWKATTDELGEAIWPQPMQGTVDVSGSMQNKVLLRAVRPGFQTGLQWVDPRAGEAIIGLERYFAWRARVVDAQSKEPIESFTVVISRISPVTNRAGVGVTVTGRNGGFTFANRTAYELKQPHVLKIVAVGYEALNPQVTPGVEGTNVFELRRLSPLPQQ